MADNDDDEIIVELVENEALTVEVNDNFTSFESIYGDPSSNTALDNYVQKKLKATTEYTDQKTEETLLESEKYANQLAYRSGSTTFLVLSVLPISGEPNIIYFIPKTSTTEEDEFDEYVWVANHFELLGGDLHEYYKKEAIDTLLLLKQDATSEELQTTDKTIVGAINELKTQKVGVENLHGLNGIKVRVENGQIYIEAVDLTSANFSDEAIVEDLDDEIYITGTVPTLPTTNAVKVALTKKEDVSNKTDDVNTSTSWNYPSSKALYTGLSAKLDKDDETVTKQGNEFNGASQLVQTDENGKLPAIDGSNLTNLIEASETTKGIVQIATIQQTEQGIIENKAVSPKNLKTELDKKQDKLTFDSKPTDNSLNPVTSEGIYEALKGKVDKVTGKVLSSNDFTDELKEKLEHIVIGEVGVVSVNGKTGVVHLDKDDIDLGNVDNTSDAEKNSAEATLTNKYINADDNTLRNINTSNFKADSIARTISTKPVDTKLTTEKAVKTELDKKQDKLTFDNTPTDGSINPVTSEGIYEALKNKVDKVTGKELSSNDFTNALKTKLENIEADAEKNVVLSVNSKVGNVVLNKDDIGLDNVDNTSDANKPLSTATKNALARKQDKLTAGTNIVIEDNVISSIPKTYTAGKGIEISNDVISSDLVIFWGEIEGAITNQTDLIELIEARASKKAFDSAVFEINNRIDDLELGVQLSILELEEKIATGLAKKQDKLTAGAGISIDSNNVISATSVSTEWGKITGTLEDQTDLKNALDEKADIEDVPTKVSELTNDSGFDTVTSVDTKLATKQDKLTAGAGINITDNVISATISSIDWGNIQGDLEDQTDLKNALDEKADVTDIPTKVSELTNDSGFDTVTNVDTKLATKQNKLTAGTGITITNDVISAIVSSIDWGNIQGSISDQTDLKNVLDEKADILDIVGMLKRENVVAGENVTIDYITGGNIRINASGGSSDIDDVTIKRNSDNKIYVQALKTKNDKVLYFWEGTRAEWEAGRSAGTIADDWFCWISDDGEPILESVTWGNIVGTLADQADLKNALDAKQDKLTSGTNIKTINNQSILGSGNINVSSSVTYDSTNKRLTWG